VGIIAGSGEGTTQYLRAGPLGTKKHFARRGAASIQVEHHVVPFNPTRTLSLKTVREKNKETHVKPPRDPKRFFDCMHSTRLCTTNWSPSTRGARGVAFGSECDHHPPLATIAR
jgi:hypothetical protein